MKVFFFLPYICYLAYQELTKAAIMIKMRPGNLVNVSLLHLITEVESKVKPLKISTQTFFCDLSKGGLISESFSHWPHFLKKWAKNYHEHLLFWCSG